MKKMTVDYRVLGCLRTNTYFLINEETSETIVVDPADSAEYIMSQFEFRGYKMAGILLTHGHFDHTYGAEHLRKLSGTKIYAYESEKKLLEEPELNGSQSWAAATSCKADVFLKDGEEFELAGFKFKVLHTPGHTAGSCCYYCEEEEALISGDTLFKETFGRTDLPTGSLTALIKSLRNILFKLPPETDVFPGHGDFTTIEYELRHNPVSREKIRM